MKQIFINTFFFLGVALFAWLVFDELLKDKEGDTMGLPKKSYKQKQVEVVYENIVFMFLDNVQKWSFFKRLSFCWALLLKKVITGEIK